MYQNTFEMGENKEVDRKAFVALFPSKFNRSQLNGIDSKGIIKPGTEVNYGDPLILGLEKTKYDAVHRGRKPIYTDNSVVWKHKAPGVVTDVSQTKDGGWTATVKAFMPMREGDKLCYDPRTTYEDKVATRNPGAGCGEYHNPTHLWEYDYDGLMYKLVTKQLNMLVTPNHKLWAKEVKWNDKPIGEYKAVTAQEVFDKKSGGWQFDKRFNWQDGKEQKYFYLKPHGGKGYNNDITRFKMDDWLEFLGYYISEGWLATNSVCKTTRIVKIGQFRKSKYWKNINDLLLRMKLKYAYSESGRFELNSKQLYALLKPLGKAIDKYVPDYIQGLSKRQIGIFLDAYINGDGHRGPCLEFSTSSYKLILDLQLLYLKLGYTTSIKEATRTDNLSKHRHWRCRVNTSHLEPSFIKRKIKKADNSNLEAMVPYAGSVYCVTVPNHTIYVKREEKSYWSQNSGQYG